MDIFQIMAVAVIAIAIFSIRRTKKEVKALREQVDLLSQKQAQIGERALRTDDRLSQLNRAFDDSSRADGD